MTAKNNDVLYNAAVQGILAASTDGSTPIGGTSYTALVTAAEAVAGQIDTAIANDNTISTSVGVPIAGSVATGAQSGNQLAKAAALGQICYAVFRGSQVVGSISAANVTGIVGLYTAAIAAIQVT